MGTEINGQVLFARGMADWTLANRSTAEGTCQWQTFYGYGKIGRLLDYTSDLHGPGVSDGLCKMLKYTGAGSEYL
jgi:hypothetical protein